MLTQCASNPRVQPNELKVAAHQFQPAVRSELFVTELDRKLSLDRPLQPPYLTLRRGDGRALSWSRTAGDKYLYSLRPPPLFFHFSRIVNLLSTHRLSL